MIMTEFKQLLETVFKMKEAIIMRRTPLNQLQAVDILTDTE